jgi:hypothetical protein
MDFELVKIEGREKQDAAGLPWFTVSECFGRAGCFLQDVGFASTGNQFSLRSSGFAAIGQRLIEAGIKQGQRAIVRITRTYPKGEIAYFRFSAQ